LEKYNPPEVAATTDGGLTWTVISNVSWLVTSNVSSKPRVDFISDHVGWADAQSGEETALVKTTDGEKSWRLLTPIMEN
jgi:photosystem II stability/assembly factor-like uncharacterized protein